MPWSGPRGPRACVRHRARRQSSGFGIDLDDRTQSLGRSDRLLDPREVEIDELPRRVPARLHPLLKLLDSRLIEWKRGGWPLPVGPTGHRNNTQHREQEDLAVHAASLARVIAVIFRLKAEATECSIGLWNSIGTPWWNA